MTDDQLAGEFHADAEQNHHEEPPQYGVGPFSIREVALVGVWLIAFVVSFFSIDEGRFNSVWTASILWILSIGVPTVAVFLIVLRRLSPTGIRRVGSLGIDQFASVAFSVASIVWLQLVWETVAFAMDSGRWVRTWVIWVELVLMLIGVVLTVFAPLLPSIGQDFRGRPEIPAHRNARQIRPISPRPAAPRAQAPESAGFGDYAPPAAQPASAPGAAGYDAHEPATATTVFEPAQTRDTFEPVEAQAGAESATAQPATAEPVAEAASEPVAEPAPRHQAFWALVPEERDVVDEIGIPVFRIGPTAWALVIEDRGDTFVVRHEDGRIGYLRDVSGVTRG
ncbi:hypothetical protein [Microbacterium flavescens]|uniref:hypothetical protein n=1 Tax=Microbacterium flavescens TaxID=69366 RepID=UPI0027DCDFAC|nr:hypothetical protein [Microbacterium flavescens]BFF11142.1 hypothetical protein GCM10025699_24450 [Microbacterium flavescens]